MNVSVNFKGYELDVNGNYNPGEPDELYTSNGEPGTPGFPSEFEVEEIIIEGVNLTDLFENLNLIDEIESLILEKIENE